MAVRRFHLPGLVSLLALGVVPCAVAAPLAPQGPGVPFDLQGFVDQAVKAGSKRIVVPPGRYRVTPRNGHHLVLRDLHDTRIIADGVEMICTETTRALSIGNCSNLTVRGLMIDHDPLPFTQGRITALSADKRLHEIELFDGYPAADRATTFKYEIFRPDTRTLRGGDCYPGKVEAVDPKHLRVTNPGGSATDPWQVGDIIAIGADYAPHGSIPHDVEVAGSTGVRLEDITVFCSNCFAFVEFNCDGTTYFRCKVDRRPAASDPVQRADPRIRSLNADAFHSLYAVKGPAYIECSARFMGDDCINICGDYHLITASTGRVLRVLSKQSDGINIAAGDKVELLAYSGLRLPDATVVRVEPDTEVTDAEKQFLAKQPLDAGIKEYLTHAKAFRITLDREVDLPMGSAICSTSRTGSGFVVRGCSFGFNRSRGILVKGSDGVIEGNTLTANAMAAVLVSPEWWWLESGSGNNVVVRGNTVTRCGGTAILVEAYGGEGLLTGTPAPAGAHRNIAIVGNTISECPRPNLRVTSTDGLRIEGNTFRLPTGAPQTDAIRLENCAHVTQADNKTVTKP